MEFLVSVFVWAMFEFWHPFILYVNATVALKSWCQWIRRMPQDSYQGYLPVM